MRYIDSMIGVPEFDDMILVAIIIAAIFIALEKATQNNPKRKITQSTSSAKMYACGEDLNPRELSKEPQSFYSAFINTFKLAKIRNLHDGDLSQYLYWMFGAMMVIIVLMVFI